MSEIQVSSTDDNLDVSENLMETVEVQESPTLEVVVSDTGVLGPQGLQGIQGIQGEKGDTGVGMPESGVPVVTTNKHRNPRPSTNTTWWSSNNSTVVAASFDASVDGGAIKWTVGANPTPSIVSMYMPTTIFANLFPTSVGSVEHLSINIIAPVKDTIYRFAISWRDASNAAIGAVEYGAYEDGPTTGQTKRVHGSFVAPANAVAYYAMLFAQTKDGSSLAAGTVACWTNKLLVGNRREYFDGDSVGARWTSTPHNSTSELLFDGVARIPIPSGTITSSRVLLSSNTDTGWSMSSAGYYEGNGSPESVVAAPVGSRYIDKSATNGAIEWIKATGVSTTGWKVVYGDTGNRRIDTLLSNGWASVAEPTWGMKLRREGSTVYLTGYMDPPASGADATAMRPLTLPDGFRPSYIAYGSYHLIAPLRTSYSVNISTGGLVEIYPTAPIAADNGFLQATFHTANNWPTALPGVAV